MRLLPAARSLLTCLAFALAVPTLCAADSPLRLVPEQADIVIEAKEPGKLVEMGLNHPLFKEITQLELVREQFESTNIRRFLQLVAYYEKQLGDKWPALLDRLTGGGVALAVKYGADPAPALLVIQGKDEKAMQQFLKLGLEIAEQELARQDSKDKIEKAEYRKVEVIQTAKNAFVALAGSALVVSNNEKALRAAIDLHFDGPAKSIIDSKRLAAAKKLLPPDCPITLCANLEPVHALPGAKDIYAMPNLNQIQTGFVGAYVDVFSRSPYLAVGFKPEKDGVLTTIRFPAGKEGGSAVMGLHTSSGKDVGTRPLLEPKNTIYSTSFYFDPAKLWEDREKLFTPQIVKAFEEADKNSGNVPIGATLSKVLGAAGTYHRFVVAQPTGTPYKTKPQTPIPAFAFVTEQRDPEVFGKAAEAGIRTAALFAGAQVGLKLDEQKHNGHTIVGYRFAEDKEFKQDAQNIRFNFTPCFVQVGKQFVVASTMDLGKELVDILVAEEKDKGKGEPASVRTRFYGEGGAEILKSIEDILQTQAILGLALPADEATKQVKALLGVVRKLGTFQLEANYSEKEFHYDLRLILGKKD